MSIVRIIYSLADIDQNAWDSCFPDALENYVYLQAIETSGMVGFDWCYVIAEEAGQVVAAMPAFLTNYHLDTTLEGAGKAVTNVLTKIFPHVLTMKLACLGSPDTEYGLIGFHPAVAEDRHPHILAMLLTAFKNYAATKKYHLIGLKDIPVFQADIWDAALKAGHYRSIAGLPVAVLDIDFAHIGDYMARLSASTRKDMRRKLRSLQDVRIEQRDDIDDVLPQLFNLYQQTRARADMQFEELTPRFFQNVLSSMPGQAFFTLYFVDDVLLGANLLLRDSKTLLDKFFCMDGERGRDYNLYFLSWFQNINYCLTHGLKTYQSGQAAYDNKLRLGSNLIRTTMWFKHKNRLMQTALKVVAPLLAADDQKEAA